MSHELPEPGSPRDWMRHARADLAMARGPLPPDGMYKMLGFHAQQAAEKAVKAVLISRMLEFPHTHSLTRLIDLLPSDIPRTEALVQSVRLMAYATTFRYPGESDLTFEDHREAVLLAEGAVAWAEGIIGRP